MKKRVKMKALHHDEMGGGGPVVRVSGKRLGVLEYSLQEDGTWRTFIGEELVVPILEVSGPDMESIALHLQELRDVLGQRDTHNVRLFHCIWRKPTLLRVAIGSSTTAYHPSRMELADVLIENFKRQQGKPFERAFTWAVADYVAREIDQEVLGVTSTEAEE